MIRVQRSRRHPLRPGARYVGRPTRWGNPYPIGPGVRWARHHWITYSRSEAVALFRVYAARRLEREPDWLDPLLDAPALACWCLLDDECHADVLIELCRERIGELRDLVAS